MPKSRPAGQPGAACPQIDVTGVSDSGHGTEIIVSGAGRTAGAKTGGERASGREEGVAGSGPATVGPTSCPPGRSSRRSGRKAGDRPSPKITRGVSSGTVEIPGPASVDPPPPEAAAGAVAAGAVAGETSVVVTGEISAAGATEATVPREAVAGCEDATLEVPRLAVTEVDWPVSVPREDPPVWPPEPPD